MFFNSSLFRETWDFIPRRDHICDRNNRRVLDHTGRERVAGTCPGIRLKFCLMCQKLSLRIRDLGAGCLETGEAGFPGAELCGLGYLVPSPPCPLTQFHPLTNSSTDTITDINMSSQRDTVECIFKTFVKPLWKLKIQNIFSKNKGVNKGKSVLLKTNGF